MRADSALLRYVGRTQAHALPHVQTIQTDQASQYVVLDPVTRKNLELTETLAGEERPTLFSPLDHCQPPMGSRLLRRRRTAARGGGDERGVTVGSRGFPIQSKKNTT